MRIFDYLIYLIFRIVFGFAELLPKPLQRFIVSLILEIFLSIRSDYVEVAKINMRLVLPHKSEAELDHLFKLHKKQIIEHLIDLINWPKITQAWLTKNIEFVGIAKFNELKAANPERGNLLVSGHLASFELIPDLVALQTGNIHYLVRRLKNSYIDQWWNNRRTARGNITLDRRDSFRKVLSVLKQGGNLGILFDQNIVRKSAVFTNWFGMTAATTKGPAIAIIKTNPHCFILGLKRKPDVGFVLELKYCDFSDILNNQSLDQEQQIFQITQRLVDNFQPFILDQPEDWFWMHRRWKTTVNESIPENFYDRKATV